MAQVVKQIWDAYEPNAVSVRIAQNWFKRFQSGSFDVKDEPRFSRPVKDKVDVILEKGPFAEAFNKLTVHPQKIVQMWWESQSVEYFEMLVDIFKSVIVYELMQPSLHAHRVTYA
ncbi:hypothetical protein EVAR_49157_1 [Eumeta japonica]|uniref:Mos1 transposase HTH domain-containing protein n=1 Tax=Eumeta variegata TaxID=151549 RepID=A0A4C1YN68_EUMVA|nr:hypothetical protein EVAR_49157_1 [Eumeta japonica]